MDDAKLPRVVCTDRGPGLFTQNGYFIREYKDALDHHGFRAYAGDYDGTGQPGDLADCWPHERIAAWVKYWLSKHPLPKLSNLDRMEELVGLRLADWQEVVWLWLRVCRVRASSGDPCEPHRSVFGSRGER